ncbi:MAG: hypothetical protein UT69_C0020G0003 [Candidatus Yanofskybacteria bacterium GW2011_GWE1_40_10]|nr:MAG: hypothetical protein UT69_C0020G0003 [Candidatus Yanofskybacteria bacterium GW2011_GWE1_40_10]
MTKFKENRDIDRAIGDNKKIIVFYHKDCTDGFCGAWAAWMKFGDTAEYVGIEPNAKAPLVNDKEIYTIDVGFLAEENVVLMANNIRLTSIDHHVSRKDSVPMTQDYSFDLEHSGCVLAWQYFHPEKPVPKLLSRVEDFDLWRFRLIGTDAIVSFLDLYDFNFDIYSKLIEDFEDDKKVAGFIEKGKLLLEYENKQVDRAVSNNAQLAIFEGIKTYVVNAHVYHSRIGARLAEILPPMALIWHEKRHRRYASLRSDGTVDVSAMAAKYGGGGHRASAGFTFELGERFPWEYINE